MMTKKILLAFMIFIALLLSGRAVYAFNENQVDYGSQPVIDTDLDGLTDQGELQLYRTDPQNADTDGDGILDGAEVLAGSDPLDAKTFLKLAQDAGAIGGISEAPWVWYAIRAAGLVAFFLLYLNIFFGLMIRFPGLNKIIKPFYSLETHCDMSLYSLFFVFLHLGFLVGHKFGEQINFGFRDVLIPFVANYHPFQVGMGIISFYLMLVLITTSYVRKYIPRKVWRITHFANLILYLTVVGHAVFLGTDLKGRVPANIFIGANLFLLALFVIALIIAWVRYNKLKNITRQNPGQPAV